MLQCTRKYVQLMHTKNKLTICNYNSCAGRTRRTGKQGEGGGWGYKQHGCFWANLDVERSWLAQVGHLSPLHEWVQKAVFWACGASISDNETFLACKGGH